MTILLFKLSSRGIIVNFSILYSPLVCNFMAPTTTTTTTPTKLINVVNNGGYLTKPQLTAADIWLVSRNIYGGGAGSVHVYVILLLSSTI